MLIGILIQCRVYFFTVFYLHFHDFYGNANKMKIYCYLKKGNNMVVRNSFVSYIIIFFKFYSLLYRNLFGFYLHFCPNLKINKNGE